MKCQCCGGDLMKLGRLGRLFWFRCRSCGMQFSRDLQVELNKRRSKALDILSKTE